MRRIRLLSAMVILLAFILSFGSSLSEGRSYIPCDCGSDPCECFIQLGDEGGAVKKIITILIEKKYLGKKTSKDMLTREVEKAIRQFQQDNNLDATGMMDDDTLTLLLHGVLPEQLDTMYPHSNCSTIYIPTDGGKKRHSNPECSGMYDPRKVSDRNAEELGFDPCKKCYIHTP